MLTLSEFQATRVAVANVGAAIGFDDGDEPRAGFTYANNVCYIERQGEGFYLNIERSDWTSKDLGRLESILWARWYLPEFALDEPLSAAALADFTAACLAAHDRDDDFGHLFAEGERVTVAQATDRMQRLSARPVSDFWTHFHAIEKAALASPDGAAFAAQGFALHPNGGNCTAWRKELPNREMLITDLDGFSHELAQDGEDRWLIGIYELDPDGSHNGLEDCREAATVEEALRVAAELAALPPLVGDPLPPSRETIPDPIPLPPLREAAQGVQNSWMVFRARVESRNFTFEAFGTTETGALSALANGLRRHAAQYRLADKDGFVRGMLTDAVAQKIDISFSDGAFLRDNEAF